MLVVAISGISIWKESCKRVILYVWFVNSLNKVRRNDLKRQHGNTVGGPWVREEIDRPYEDAPDIKVEWCTLLSVDGELT